MKRKRSRCEIQMKNVDPFKGGLRGGSFGLVTSTTRDPMGSDREIVKFDEISLETGMNDVTPHPNVAFTPIPAPRSR